MMSVTFVYVFSLFGEVGSSCGFLLEYVPDVEEQWHRLLSEHSLNHHLGAEIKGYECIQL